MLVGGMPEIIGALLAFAAGGAATAASSTPATCSVGAPPEQPLNRDEAHSEATSNGKTVFNISCARDVRAHLP
jgi:hypothetical protein